ncbi:hypothetical protein P154DRAFT_176767 [Amniculicola lignicola CBS 123094]|uniref:Uncharacterized protein n=1 Tax=Amniculicola lignicola CBS 123094 TaxID=1392246 RepID=A0A6A5WYC5_9PLEO|nr:hypothetical protein P154DRAFT_176767 [Amniculicola lignicola CBS 123094]
MEVLLSPKSKLNAAEPPVATPRAPSLRPCDRTYPPLRRVLPHYTLHDKYTPRCYLVPYLWPLRTRYRRQQWRVGRNPPRSAATSWRETHTPLYGTTTNIYSTKLRLDRKGENNWHIRAATGAGDRRRITAMKRHISRSFRMANNPRSRSPNTEDRTKETVDQDAMRRET